MTVNIKNRLSQNQISYLIPILLFLAALIIRLLYLNQIESIPIFDNPVMDEKYHIELAEQINSDEGLPDEPFFRAPMYPYLLASLSKLTSGSLFWIRFIQILLGSLLPLLIYLLGLKLFNRQIAFWSAVAALFYPTFLYYDSSLLITFLITLLSVFLILYLYRYNSNSFINPITVGILLGAAGLARPNILLLGPFLLIWIWVILKPKIGIKKALIHYLVIGLTSIMIILPITIRNYQVSGDFVFIAWQGGMNFYIGNNHQSTGWSATLPGIDKSWEGGYNEAIAFAEQNKKRSLKKSEVSDFWTQETIREIKEYPSDFFQLLIKKIRLLINGYEIPNNTNIYLAKDYSPIIDILLFNKYIYFPFGILIPLALIGIAFSLKEWRKFLPIYLFLFAYGGSLVLFFVCARFRQPLIPFFILFAVYAVYQIINQIKKKEMKNLLLIVVVLLLLFAESNHDILNLNQQRVKAEDYHLLGNSYLEHNNLAAAETEYKKSIIADSTFARGYNNLGLVNGRRSKYIDAARNFEKAIQLDPNVVESYMNYATIEIIKGDFIKAIQILETTKQRFPLNDFVMLKLGMTYFQAGRLEDAKIAVEQAIRLNPNNQQNQMVYKQILDAIN